MIGPVFGDLSTAHPSLVFLTVDVDKNEVVFPFHWIEEWPHSNLISYCCLPCTSSRSGKHCAHVFAIFL